MYRRAAFLSSCLLVAALAGPACADHEIRPRTQTHRAAVTAYCTAQVNGVGQVDVETDYLPHVITCENGGAGLEALKAQAVAARSYLYYKLDTSGSINDGTSDQVYSCAATPGAQHYQAVDETAGQVLTYSGVTICAFYVAGAIPSATSCIAGPGDNDYSGTEHYVTYNWNLSGNNIEQTSLGWVDPGNLYNRGCKSQNGADCLSDQGWGYADILRFYYGMDIGLETAVGSCVTPTECTAGETENEPCDPCGTRTRTCDGSGNWGSWSACSGGACTPGDTGSQPCGDCGVQTRTCASDCTWGGWSACESVSGNEAPCHTGEPGLCGVGSYACEAGQLVCESANEPRPERCDNLDDNCDGLVDEGFPQVLGDPPPPWAARLSVLSFPDQLDPGVPGPIQLQIENLGTMGWGQSFLELHAAAVGGGPSQLRADSWLDGLRVLQVGPVNAGETAVLDFELTVNPAATGELHEILWLVRTNDASPVPIACPSPAVNVNVSASGTVNTGIPDAGPDTEPVPRVVSGCSCRTGASPSGLGLALLLLGWIFLSRRRRRR